MRNRSDYLFLGMLIFLPLALIGCVSAPTTPQPTSMPTLTPTLKPSTTFHPLETMTPSLELPIPPMPSQTLNLTERAYIKYWDAVEKTETASAPLTQIAQSTLKAIFPESCSSPYTETSPDGNWLADDCGHFLVVSRDRQKKIIIKHSEFDRPEMTVSNIIPHYWTKDSQYLYFSPHFCCEDTNPHSLAGPLYRLNIQSLTWTKIIDDSPFNLYVFSSTGRRLLHVPNAEGSAPPIKLHILDLKSGTEQWLTLDGFKEVDDVMWSPDGRRFVITGQNGIPFETEVGIALFLVSLDNLSITNVIPVADAREFIWMRDWSADDVLTFEDCYFYQHRTVRCNLVTYDLKAPPVPFATPTP